MNRRQGLIIGLAAALEALWVTRAQAVDGGTHTANVLRWQSEIAAAARRFSLPDAWILAVMEAESGGLTRRDGQPLRSPKGAIGLMQVMPATYAEMRRLYGLGDDPDAPGDNIMAGAAYLRLNLDRFGYPGLFAAYNAGPERYARSLAGGTLPSETREYLARLIRTTRNEQAIRDSVFVDLADPSGHPEADGRGVFVNLGSE